MKIVLSILIVLITITGFSQTTIDKSSIDSGGAIATNATVNVIYTIGEVAVQEATLGNIHISEGFISAKTMSSLGIANYTQLIGVTLYPNPATDFINIQFATRANYEISIYDLVGKELGVYHLTNSDTQRITINQLASAIYVVVLINKDAKQYKTYKIIKK